MLYIDEFGHIQDNIAREFYENVYPTISSSKISQIIITSTPNGFNLFYDIYTAAVNGLNEYTSYRVDWWQVPGRDEKWRDETIANLGSEEAFNVQYANEFITADGRLLSSANIEYLNKNKIEYVLREFEELEDLELDYEKYLTFKESFDLEEIEDSNNFFIFSIDIAEGGGGSSDSSIINIFKLDALEESFFDKVTSPTSFQDFFGLKQIGIFSSNELSIEDFAKIAYTLIFDIFNSENCKVVLEMNTYGGEFISKMQSIFPGKNDFDDEVIVKFKHKADSKVAKMGLKVKLDNKPIMAQNFKKYFSIGKIEINEKNTIEETISFGKDKHGRYMGLKGHDDIIMTCINGCEFFKTMDYGDFVDEYFETIDDEIRNKINAALELAEAEGDSLQFDIYSIVGSGGNYYGDH